MSKTVEFLEEFEARRSAQRRRIRWVIGFAAVAAISAAIYVPLRFGEAVNSHSGTAALAPGAEPVLLQRGYFSGQPTPIDRSRIVAGQPSILLPPVSDPGLKAGARSKVAQQPPKKAPVKRRWRRRR